MSDGDTEIDQDTWAAMVSEVRRRGLCRICVPTRHLSWVKAQARALGWALGSVMEPEPGVSEMAVRP